MQRREHRISRPFEVSNADKVFFPEAGITKGDLIDYYERVAALMLPHVRLLAKCSTTNDVAVGARTACKWVAAVAGAARQTYPNSGGKTTTTIAAHTA